MKDSYSPLRLNARAPLFPRGSVLHQYRAERAAQLPSARPPPTLLTPPTASGVSRATHDWPSSRSVPRTPHCKRDTVIPEGWRVCAPARVHFLGIRADLALEANFLTVHRAPLAVGHRPDNAPHRLRGRLSCPESGGLSVRGQGPSRVIGGRGSRAGFRREAMLCRLCDFGDRHLESAYER